MEFLAKMGRSREQPRTGQSLRSSRRIERILDLPCLSFLSNVSGLERDRAPHDDPAYALIRDRHTGFGVLPVTTSIMPVLEADDFRRLLGKARLLRLRESRYAAAAGLDRRPERRRGRSTSCGGKRTKRAAEAVMRALRHLSVNVVGVVLAHLDLKKHDRNRYGDAGGPYYRRYRRFGTA